MNDYKKHIMVLIFFMFLTNILFPSMVEAWTKSRDKEEKELISQIESYYSQGKKNLDRGDFLMAIVKFNRVIELEKDFCIVYTPYAKKYIEQAQEKVREKEEAQLNLHNEEETPYAKKYIEQAQDKIEEKEPKVNQIVETITTKSDTQQEESQVKTTKFFEYTIGQDDVLGIYVWQKVIQLKEVKGELMDEEDTKEETQALEYTINIEDVLYIHIWQEEALSQEVIVRPDGRISFPLAGDVPAAGLTFNELKEELAQRLKEYIKSPVISISLRKSSGKKKKVITFEEKLSQEVIVRPDGRISFPLAGDVPAAGLTFNELKEELTQRLKEYIKQPEVSISLKKMGGRKVIVLGEVRSPGVYSVTGKSTILEAIGKASGFTPDAVPASTILIRGGLQNPQARRLNLKRAIGKADMSQNVILQPEDVVYVPKKFIANLNYVLSQILGPISQGASASKNLQDW